MTNRAGCDIILNCYVGAFDRKGDVMSEKRKDNKGRLLRTGESQRKDLTYMYRYKDNDGTRRSLYAPTLSELREKEDEIADKLRSGLIVGKTITVANQVKAYLKTKRAVKESTRLSYENACKKLWGTQFAAMDIREVTRQVVKLWFVSQEEEEGVRYGTLVILFGLLKNAFEQAVEDDVLLKNPCAFRLSAVIKKDVGTRSAVEEEDVTKFLEYIKSVPKYARWYNQIFILAHTGMRVAELCGLIAEDVDMENNLITIRRQTCYSKNKGRYLDTPKTKTSCRKIPMNTVLKAVMQDSIAACKRRKVVVLVDGLKDFLFVSTRGELSVGRDVSIQMRRMIAKYNKTHDDQLPYMTPHTLRHTFCTTSIAKGMDPKSVQYILGHSSPDMTMKVYSHARYSDVRAAFERAYGA